MNRHQRRLTEKQNRRTASTIPQEPNAIVNEAQRLFAAGQLAEAERLYRKLVGMNIQHPAIFNNLGVILERQGQAREAVAFYKSACAFQQDNADFYANLGKASMRCGRPDEAFAAFQKATKLCPGHETYWYYLADALQRVTFSSANESLYQDLLVYLQHPAIPARSVCLSILSALRCHPDFKQALWQTQYLNGKPSDDYAKHAEALSALPLFLKLLELSQISAGDIEQMLVWLRSSLIMAIAKGEQTDKSLPFFAALAIQCFFNNYVFDQTPEEIESAQNIQSKLSALIDAGEPLPPVWVASLAAYQPLYQLPWAPKLAAMTWPAAMHLLIKRQILEPLEEERLRGTIPSLTNDDNAVSLAVRNQYEENPYPRWTKIRLAPKPETITTVIQTLFPYLDLCDDVSPEAPDILVAGCGTGEHAISVASRFANAHVLGIDLSLSSLAYALRKTREIGLANIDYARADILELGSFPRQFDLIESAGVLHHLENPMAGWRVLVSLLRPGGLMKIALYSEAARKGIVKAREVIAKESFPPTPEGMRRCRQYIRTQKNDSALMDIPLLRDFYDLSECRDLLFHVQEHRFTIPRIDTALDALGLQFLGFETDILRQNMFQKAYPTPSDMARLSLWHDLEQKNSSIFSGMYQFWCRKKK